MSAISYVQSHKCFDTKPVPAVSNMNVMKCIICNAIYVNSGTIEEQRKIYRGTDEYTMHSCGENRRSKRGDGPMMCGRCRMPVKDMDDFQDHFHRVHGSKPLLQKEIDFEKARKDMTKFPCERCRRVFKDGYEWDNHQCVGENMTTHVQGQTGSAIGKLKDVAKILACVGTPDPEKPQTLIVCGVCGNRFPEEDVFRKHTCVAHVVGKKRIAIMVAIDREDKTHMDQAVKEHGGDVTVIARGMTQEEYILKLFRESGAGAIKFSHDDQARRDIALLQYADICLMFPSKKNQKSDAIKEGTIIAGGLTVKVKAYPDKTYENVQSTPDVTAKQEPTNAI